MLLLVSVVFRDIVKVVSSHDDGSLHFGGDHHSLEYSVSDENVANEGAFLVDAVTLDALFGSLEPQSNILEVSDVSGGLLGQERF